MLFGDWTKMMHSSRLYLNPEQHPVTIRAIQSLTPSQADAVRQAVGALSAEWSVDQHEDYEGHLSIVVSRDGQRGTGPTFLISGSVDRIELAELRADELHRLGDFSAIDELIAELTRTLAVAAGEVDSNVGTILKE